MTYLEDVLKKYKEHIPDYEEMVCLLDLLPYYTQYRFIMRLLLFKKYMKKGDLKNGEKTVGFIKLDGNQIILTDIELENGVILITLPELWEI